MLIGAIAEPISPERIQGVKRTSAVLSAIDENLQHNRRRFGEKVNDAALGLANEASSPVQSPSPPLSDRAIKFLKRGDRLMAFNFSLESKISILSVWKTPYAQTIRLPHLAPSSGGGSRSSLSLPFSEWSIQQQVEGATRLKQLGAPVSITTIEKIYGMLKNFLEELCHDRSTEYPALYYLCAFEQNEYDQEVDQDRYFTLEISSDTKASLLFFLDKETFISRGASKKVWKGFSLDSLQLKAFGISRECGLNSCCIREEKYLSDLQECPSIVNVDRISYYYLPTKKVTWQWIEMKFYTGTLSPTSDSEYKLRSRSVRVCAEAVPISFDYSIQFMEGVAYLHSKGIIHRDIKPSNVLVEGGRLALTDFGISCERDDLEALNEKVGSFPYFSPERWVKYFDISDSGLSDFILGTPIDVWSAGCVLWHLFKEGSHPWFGDIPTWTEEVNSIFSKKYILSVLEKMKEFDGQEPEKGGLDFLLWKMLRYRPDDRWTAQEVLDELKRISGIYFTRCASFS